MSDEKPIGWSGELHESDPAGNVMPQGMYWRGSRTPTGYVGVFYVRAMRGERRKRSTGRADYKGALKRYHEIMKEWNDGSTSGRVPTLAVYWARDYRPTWVVGHKTPHDKRVDDAGKPVYRDDHVMKVVLPSLGSVPLDAITPSRAQKWANDRLKRTYVRKEGGRAHPVKPTTVRRELQLLQTIFNRAIDDRLIEHNPWKLVARAKPLTRQRVLTPEEQSKLLSVMSPRYQRWLLFMLGTGLRIEEALRIDPAADLDLVARWVRVTRKSRGLIKKVQKVPIVDPATVEVLQAQLAAEGALWHASSQNYRQKLEALSARAGIEHVSPHVLRHTFATRFLQGGGDIYVLSKILGHSSVKITETVYAHLLSEDLLARSRGISLGVGDPTSASAQTTASLLPFPQPAGANRVEAAS